MQIYIQGFFVPSKLQKIKLLFSISVQLLKHFKGDT